MMLVSTLPDKRRIMGFLFLIPKYFGFHLFQNFRMVVEPFDDVTNSKIRVFHGHCSKYFLLNFKIFRRIQCHTDIGAHKNHRIGRDKMYLP